jgi:outer membrane protein OmpA-like peptidoglycan-associated protein
VATEKDEQKPKQSPWADLLSGAGKQLMPILLTAGSLIGFVAFAGGVIVWTRFSAAKVPPDQAVNAVPRDELVAIGSALLLLFGFFGVLALIGAFLVDRGARATPGMARALLVLFMVEAAITVVIADRLDFVETAAAAELVALPLAAAFWATFVDTYVRLEDDLPTRRGERSEARPYRMFLLAGEDSQVRLGPVETHWPILIAWLGIAVAAPLVAFDAPSGWLLGWLTAAIAAVIGAVALLSRREGERVREKVEGGRMAAEVEEKLDALARDRELKHSLPIDEYRELKAREQAERRFSPAIRMLNERPERLVLEPTGAWQMGILLLAAVALPSWELRAVWIAVSIAVAGALAVALWRIATLSAQRVIWYGMAVFLSVPLYGTFSAMARNVEDPQVQPMALIRSTDGPDEAIQGLYVTEADDRVYFATVATEGCTDDLRAHSGRLEWVPKSEVVAMSIGPLQDIEEAAASALEMAYALTPAVETPAGTRSSFTSGELETAKSEPATPGAATDKRLEDTGPAVRPNYGAGLSLSPEDASPGERVTLRMSAPNDEVRGFGRTREGKTLRVGGVRAAILKEFAHRADTAEYVETLDGVLLRLEKDEPYVEASPDEYEAVEDFDPREGGRFFLRLVDNRVQSVEVADRHAKEKKPSYQERTMDERGIFLPIEVDGSGVPVLKRVRTVKLKGPVDGAGKAAAPIETSLDPRPKAQAWHERQIRFVVPEKVSSGAVAVECSQLAGQPLLRVAHAPEARISVRMEAGSSRVRFDASRTSDADEEQVSRRWSIAGLRRGNLTEMSADLPPRPRAYVIRMTATDESGRTDTAELRLLRLPASLFRLDEARPGNEPVLREARETLEAAVSRRLPAAIELDGHADDPGTARHNVHLSLRRAEHVRDLLLSEPRVRVPGGAEIPVRTLAYGEGCPTDPHPGRNRNNRRVDVFVLEQGVSLIPPSGCHPRRLQSTEWKLPGSG